MPRSRTAQRLSVRTAGRESQTISSAGGERVSSRGGRRFEASPRVRSMLTSPLWSSAPVSPACAQLIFFTRPAHRSSSSKPAHARAVVFSPFGMPFDEGLHAEAGPTRFAGAHGAVLRAARAYKLPLVPLAVSGADVTAINGRPASTLQGQRAWMLALKPDEQMTTPAQLLDRYVGELPRELGDPNASRTAFARWEAYERVTWPEWLRSRGASPDAVKLMTAGGDSRRRLGALCPPSVRHASRFDAALQNRWRHGPFAWCDGGVARRDHPIQCAGGSRRTSIDTIPRGLSRGCRREECGGRARRVCCSGEYRCGRLK